MVNYLYLRRRRESKTNGTATATSLTNQTLAEQDIEPHQLHADTPKPHSQTCASYQILTKLT